jgi:hypothetical protein
MSSLEDIYDIFVFILEFLNLDESIDNKFDIFV